MRRIIAVMAVLMFLLSGCATQQKSMDTAMEFRKNLLNAGGCTFTAEVTAQYEQYSTDFVLQCVYDVSAQTLQFTVTEPQTISGISGTVSDNRQSVSFDDAALELALVAQERVSPVALPSILAQSWDSSYIASAGSDQNYEVAVYQNGYEDNAIQVETWFEQGIPVYADVWYHGSNEASVTVSEFNFQK